MIQIKYIIFFKFEFVKKNIRKLGRTGLVRLYTQNHSCHNAGRTWHTLQPQNMKLSSAGQANWNSWSCLEVFYSELLMLKSSQGKTIQIAP